MTELEAANKALALLGVASITSLTQEIQAARVMRSLFDSVRIIVLQEFPWSFAIRFQPLTLNGSAVIPPGWSYAFDYPAEATAVYDLRRRFDGETVDYIREGALFFANLPDIWAEYTVMPEISEWPQLVCEAFVARLASDAAAALTGSLNIAASLLEKYQLLVQIARTNSLNEEAPPLRRATHYIDVRGI